MTDHLRFDYMYNCLCQVLATERAIFCQWSICTAHHVMVFNPILHSSSLLCNPLSITI